MHHFRWILVFFTGIARYNHLDTSVQAERRIGFFEVGHLGDRFTFLAAGMRPEENSHVYRSASGGKVLLQVQQRRHASAADERHRRQILVSGVLQEGRSEEDGACGRGLQRLRGSIFQATAHVDWGVALLQALHDVAICGEEDVLGKGVVAVEG